MQLLIYVGGTLVLLIFGVMLTSQDRFVSHEDEPRRVADRRLGRRCLLLAVLTWRGRAACREWRGLDRASRSQPCRLEPTATPIGMGLLGARVDVGRSTSTASGYLLLFEIVSVHLLVVLVGAAYLARAKAQRRQPCSST